MGPEVGQQMVILASSQPVGNSSWHMREDQGSDSRSAESKSFARPSITTGAQMPWNTRKKTNFGAPRAFTHLQTVPAITLLSTKQEGTKLVYSKDSEAPESPFKPSSQVSPTEEDLAEKEAEMLPAQTTVRLVSDQNLGGEVGPRTVNLQPTSGINLQFHGFSHDHQEGAQLPHHLRNICTAPELHLGRTDTNKSCKVEVKLEQKQDFWIKPVLNFPKKTDDMCQGNAPVERRSKSLVSQREELSSLNLRSSSLHKSSDDSSQLQGTLANQTEIFDQDQAVESVALEGSSRSQSLGKTKRKATSLDDKDRQQQRAVKRRLTNRASALRSAEKKGQELSRMEKQIEKLQKEHADLQSKWKKQVKTCNELKESLSSTTDKLQIQEEENYRLKAEMDFLRSNLALLPQSPEDSMQSVHDGLPMEATSMQNNMEWNPEFPFPTAMPTQAEIAADLELDRQILQNGSGQEYLKEWQMW